jgi:hypothetical protein
MSDFDGHVRRLAALASREPVPPTNVSGRVLDRLAPAAGYDLDRPLTYLAMSSVALATAALFVVAPTIFAAMDPLDALVRVVLPPPY